MDVSTEILVWFSREPPASAAVPQRRSGQMPAELLQRAAHLGLDGADGAAADLGDLLIGQVAVLPEEEDLFFLRPQQQDRPAEGVERFAFFQRLRGPGLTSRD